MAVSCSVRQKEVSRSSPRSRAGRTREKHHEAGITGAMLALPAALGLRNVKSFKLFLILNQ